MITMAWSLKVHFAIATTLRLLLICYGRIHDVIFEVQFTDIDYYVFTDASRYVIDGHSPYNRSTYRYTPLIAWILTPTIILDIFEFGKVLFTIFDLLSALMINRIVLQDTNGDERKADISSCIVLYNPLNAVVAARGNAESLLSMIILSILYFSRRSSWIGWISASLMHGLAVHLRIYPLIYLPSIFFYSASISNNHHFKSIIWKLLINYRGYVYGLLCICTFMVLTWIFYEIYGHQFLNEALLYHLSRLDIKHNFSPYFYPLYLTQGNPDWRWIGSVAFVPQAILILLFSWYFRRDLSFCWFVSTFAFVTFNKVCTSQYFVWYLMLVPLIWYKIQLTKYQLVNILAFWTGAQMIWLGLAYLLEFRGWNTFLYVWMSSLFFLVVNCCILSCCIRGFIIRKDIKKVS